MLFRSVGTSRGVSVINADNGNISNYMGTKSGSLGFSNLNINQVYEDSRGLWWIATRDGLNIYNPKNDELKIMRTSEGLSNSFVAGIIEDDNKNMWISSASGITNIVMGKNNQGNISQALSGLIWEVVTL